MKAKAPGKLIISGEHAVVHGRPALVMAVNRYVEATLTPHNRDEIRVSFPGVMTADTMPLAALHALKERLERNYHRFQTGTLPVRHILGAPIEIVYYALIHFAGDAGFEWNQGFDLDFKTNLPVGAGMGASAATIAATLSVASHWKNKPLHRGDLYRLTLDVERLQHGHPSGVDPFIIVHGGFVRFQHGRAEALHIPRPAMHLVFTGTPESSTGECVEAVSEQYPKEHAIWVSFEKITENLQHALCAEQAERVRALIREQHRLLCEIGVVPDKVQQFIRLIEEDGGAAKICGAGSVRGDKGGVVLIFQPDAPVKRAESYGYPLLPVEPETQGAGVVRE
jgi:mevalonate kinase